MDKKRVHAKTKSAEQVAEEKKLREAFQKTKPTLEDLVASGDYEPPVRQDAYFASMAAGGSKMDEKTKASAWRVHHVGLTVSDLDRSIRFYRDLLGFTLLGRRTGDAPYLAAQTGYPNVRLEVASLRLGPEGAPTLEMVQYLSHPGEPLPTATHLPATAHVCLQVEDMVGMVARLKSEGVRFKSEPVSISAGPNRGGLGVYLFDPDGFVVELFQPPKTAG